MSESFLAKATKDLGKWNLSAVVFNVGGQLSKNYERNSHRGAFLLLTFLYASKEKLVGVQGHESPATLIF